MITQRHNHTRIMATMASDRCTPQFVEALALAGMKAIRINSAHVEPDDIRAIVATVRSVAPTTAILMDTKGPEIRTTDVDSPLQFRAGQMVEIAGIDAPSTIDRICITAYNLPTLLAPGMTVLIDDGDLRLEVVRCSGFDVEAKVLTNAVLGSRKTVNVPGCEFPPLPAVSERDRRNIEAACSAGIDMIAHSFVRTADDVNAIRRAAGPSTAIFAKIECPEAIDNFSDILAAADGILVARGDLGTCIPLAEIPALQYSICAACRRADKPVIVSTQMLHSMISNPSPTRAEVSDVALAVMEGADWVLLCGETAIGAYPAECVAVMNQTIHSVEKASLRCKLF